MATADLLQVAREAASAKFAPPEQRAPDAEVTTLGEATLDDNKLFDREGRVIRNDDPNAAFTSGTGNAAKSARYNVVDPEGNTHSVAGAELQTALGAGFRLESAEELAERRAADLEERRGTAGQIALTALEGAGRGATLGLSDVGLTSVLGDEYRKGALERKEANPFTAGAGETAGIVGATLATGGIGGAVGAPARGMAAAGRLAEGAVGAGLRGLGYEGATLAGRAGARALALGAAGATEGAFYGAGQALSDTALHGAPITAEKVLASMGENALLGGLTGGAFGVAGELASTGARAVARRIEESGGLKAIARKVADESALKAIGARGSDLRRLGKTGQKAEQEIGEIGSELLSYKFKTGEKRGERLFQFASKAEDFVDDLAHAKNETGAALGKLKGQIDEALTAQPELAPDVNRYLARVDEEILAPLRASNSPTVRGRADRVESELAGLRQRLQPVETPGIEGAAATVTPAEPVTFAELDKFRQDLRSVFQPPKPTGGGLPAPVPDHAQHLEAAERILSGELDSAAERSLAAMGKDPAEYATLKEQYRNLRQAEDIASKAALQELGNRAISPSDYATGIASGLGALLTGHVGALAAGAAGTVAHKMIRERGRSVLAILADRVARSDGELSAVIPKMLKGASATKALPAAIVSEDKSLEIMNSVREYHTDPAKQVQKLAAPVAAIEQSYPTLATNLQQQLARTYDYLQTKMPPTLSRAGSSLTPEIEKPRYSTAQVKQFGRYARGALNPQAVVKDLGRGHLDREGLEAMKALHPETFQSLRKLVMVGIAQRDEPLAFKQRILLSLAFDFKGDASMDPEFSRAIQDAHAENQPKPDQPAPTGAALPPSIAQQTALPGQSAEMP